MSAPTNAAAPTAASLAVVRALLDRATAKNHTGGVLGVHAAADWHGPETFSHQGATVRVAGCPSTLAVWEALRNSGDADWLVILTPREREELGGGVLAHLVGNNLRTPDPWQAVQQRFAADSLDSRLYARGAHSRELATGLLALLDDGKPTPAAGGVLTRDHALGFVALNQLHVTEPGLEIDVIAVFTWSMSAEATTRLAKLRNDGGNALAEEVIGWLAERCGAAASPVHALLATGRVDKLVPLGVVAGLLVTEERATSQAAGQFQGTYALGRLRPDDLAAWHADAAGILTHALASGEDAERAWQTLDAADAHARELGMVEYARESDLLPTGLRARLGELACELRAVLPSGSVTAASGGPGLAGRDEPLVTGGMAAAERALDTLRQHHLGTRDDTVRAYEAAMRLLRWLASDATSQAGTGDQLDLALRRQLAEDSWVDSAVNDAARGTGDTELADTLGELLGLARVRREAHDLRFGAALGNSTASGVAGVEQVLPEMVLPLAQQRPVLLLVLDGLSTAVANDLVSDTRSSGWAEYTLPGHQSRAGALAVLPTLTELSRSSLLCGELVQGNEDTERRGFAQLLKNARLEHQLSGGTGPPLFHKKQLDTSKPGQTLSADVHNAIADTEQLPLVGAVLNAIDDALHHTDPGGIEWSPSTVRHLKPLLEAARRAGRSVVITSDHGHVIERRQGTVRQHTATYGARARVATAEAPAAEDEVTVRGPRVLTADGTAILALDERLRYGPLNAGYHGGGAPAEAVVPVVLLQPGQVAALAGQVSIDGTTPAWWNSPVAVPAAGQSGRRAEPADEPPTPFEPSTAEERSGPAGTPAGGQPDERVVKLAKSVVASSTFKRQREIAGRVPIENRRIVALLGSMLAASDRRISAQQAAADLGVGLNRLRGALSAVKRILDIEGYVVLHYESESGQVILDETALREQFGIEDA